MLSDCRAELLDFFFNLEILNSKLICFLILISKMPQSSEQSVVIL